eukprot:12661466-Ditylum_brightwellii.AAC.1
MFTRHYKEYENIYKATLPKSFDAISFKEVCSHTFVSAVCHYPGNAATCYYKENGELLAYKVADQYLSAFKI